jgi:alkylation response protein AidB-like acyl-CoA dehydrogenase
MSLPQLIELTLDPGLLAEARLGRVSPRSWRHSLAASGLLGWDCPVRYGGGAKTATEMMHVFAHFGSIDLDLRDVPGLGHAGLLTHARNLAIPLRKRLADVCSGQSFFAIAITEPNAGSDLHGLATVAIPIPEGYLLTGEKLYVARLQQADVIIVFAFVPRGSQRLLTAMCLPRTAVGLEFIQLEAAGLQGVSFGGLRMRNLFVPIESRIGAEGEGFTLFLKHFSYWRLAMTAAAVGNARHTLDDAIHWLRQRHAFGGPIGRFTHLQQELAHRVASLHMGWLLVQSCADRLDKKLPAVADSSMAKAEVIESCREMTEWAICVFGARGYTKEYQLEKRYRDLLGLSIADGTRDVLRGQVARAVLGDAFYELALNRKSIGGNDGCVSRRRFWS